MRRRPAVIAALAAALAVLGLAAAAFCVFHTPEQPDPPGGGVRVLRNGAEAELSGPLSRAMLPPLEAALASGARTVQIDSPGGPQAAAEALARAIHAAGANTAVTDRCLSACAIVFLAGSGRWIGPFAQVGLEAAYHGASLSRAYGRAGVPARLLPAIADTPEDQAWFPTQNDMLTTGFATGLARPDQFALAGFGPSPTPVSIRKRLLGVPVYRALAEHDPAGFEADLTLWSAAVLNGQAGTEAFASTRKRLDSLSAQGLRAAPDDLLEAHGRLFVTELAWMQSHRPADCPAFAASQGRQAGPTDPELQAARADIQAELLNTPATAPPSPDAVPLQSALDGQALPDSKAILGSPGTQIDCAQLQRAWSVALAVPGGARLMVQADR